MPVLLLLVPPGTCQQTFKPDITKPRRSCFFANSWSADVEGFPL